MHPLTTAFLFCLGITIVVWVLRGFSLLSFLPGFVLWFLILLVIGTGVARSAQLLRR